MASAYTRRFGSVSSSIAGSVALFTADDQHVYVVRDIVITNQMATAQLVQVYIAAGPNNHLLLVVPALSATTSFHLDLRQELLPSEILYAYGQSGPFNCVVTGYALNP